MKSFIFIMTLMLSTLALADEFDDNLERLQLQRDNQRAEYGQQMANQLGNIGSNYLEQHKDAFAPQPAPFHTQTCTTNYGVTSCY